MENIAIGQRLPVSKIDISESAPLQLKFIRQSPIEIDVSCFALDANGKLISDDYMVFYNQPASPCGSLKLTHYESSMTTSKGTLATFEVQLSNVPSTIDSLFFVLSSDAKLNQMQSLEVELWQGSQKAIASYTIADFADQQASMLIQLYRKSGVWRLSNVAQGFNGGLASIVAHFGGDVADDAHNATAVDAGTGKVSMQKEPLEKIMLTKAPKLVNLAKKATISLEKRQLQHVTAKVALVLDATGSMNHQYTKGLVQEVIDRLLPLAVNFDDDQQLDCWAFGSKDHYLGSVGLDNYEDFVNQAHGGWRDWQCGARYNNEAGVIKSVMDFYQKDGLDVPIYVLFISDGGVSDTKTISKLITDAAKLPIFWQFVGLGGRGYGVLQKLDDLKGRVVDNCDFFEVDKLKDISEEQLYENMLQEFPAWLAEAKRIGIIKP